MNLHYFDHHLSRGFVALFSGRMIIFVANELIGLFLPIFLLIRLGERAENVFLYFLVGYLIYLFVLPLGAQLLNKVGLRRSLRISVFLVAAFYLSLFFLEKNVVVFVPLSLFLLTIYRIFFWVPYHTDFAKFTNAHDRGREVSLIWATKSVLSVVMPVIAGFLIWQYGFNIVFIMAILIYMAAYIPFLALPRTRERYSWGYFQTIKKFFAKKNRKIILANIANGAENKVGFVIWPIFMFQVFEGNYLEVGAVSSFIILISIILQMFAGKYTDLMDKRKMLHWGSVFYALGWAAKIFVLTAFQVFVVGAYHSLSKIFKNTPFDTLNYEIMADHGHYVDEYTVLKEMAMSLGGVLVMIFAIVVSLNFGLNWTFALAALASVFVNVL